VKKVSCVYHPDKVPKIASVLYSRQHLQNSAPFCKAGVDASGKTEFIKGESYMPVIKVRENEPFDVALASLQTFMREQVFWFEVRRREFYEKPTTNQARLKLPL
jgi:small subunit ribosomal protein S21